MQGFAVLLLFYFAGELLNRWLNLPLPANVIGLVLLLLALYFRWVKLEWVEKTGEYLLKHMLLFFAPVVVGVMEFFPLIEAEWLPLTIGLVGSALVVIVLSGATTTRLLRKEGEKSHGSGRS